MSYIKNNWFEFSNHINANGLLLDDNYNELRDENGEIIYIPRNEWHNCKIIKGERDE